VQEEKPEYVEIVEDNIVPQSKPEDETPFLLEEAEDNEETVDEPLFQEAIEVEIKKPSEDETDCL